MTRPAVDAGTRRRCRCCGGWYTHEPTAGHYCSPDCAETGPDLMPEEIEARMAALRRRPRPSLTEADIYRQRQSVVSAFEQEVSALLNGVRLPAEKTA